jgi:hypothetical protein
MNSAIILLALSAVTGFALGHWGSRFAIVISSLALAALSAVVLHSAGFSALSGIAIITTCLTVSQLAYLSGAALASRGSENAKKSREHPDKTADSKAWPKSYQFDGQLDEEPSKSSRNDVGHKHDRNENAPT